MADAIIRRCGIDTTDATAAASDILAGKSAYVNGVKVDGSIVVRNPGDDLATIDTSWTKEGKIGLTPPLGSYFNGGGVYVNVSNFKAANIKSGVGILGLSGTFTSDADATPADLRMGKSAYVNGNKISGAVPDYVSQVVERYGTAISGITTNTYDTQFLISIPDGYYKSSYLKPRIPNCTAANIRAGARVGNDSADSPYNIIGTFSADANASASSLLVGATAYVNGNKITGTMPNRATGTPNKIDHYRIANNRFEVAVPDGYHACWWDGGNYCYLSYAEVASTIGLTAAKLVSGNTILGIAGTATIRSLGGTITYTGSVAVSGVTSVTINYPSCGIVAMIKAWCHGAGYWFYDNDLRNPGTDDINIFISEGGVVSKNRITYYDTYAVITSPYYLNDRFYYEVYNT